MSVLQKAKLWQNDKVHRLLPTLSLCMCEHHQILKKMEMWMQIDTSNDDEYWMLDNSMGGKTDEQR